MKEQQSNQSRAAKKRARAKEKKKKKAASKEERKHNEDILETEKDLPKEISSVNGDKTLKKQNEKDKNENHDKEMTQKANKKQKIDHKVQESKVQEITQNHNDQSSESENHELDNGAEETQEFSSLGLSLFSTPISAVNQLLFPSEIEAHPTTFPHENKVILSQLTLKERATLLLEYMLQEEPFTKPLTITDFFQNVWEKNVLHVANKVRKHKFHGLLTKEDIEQLIINQPLRYGHDLNITKVITSGKDGVKKRITLDPQPETDHPNDDTHDKSLEQPQFVNSKFIWKQFHQNKCTIRLLCPQKYMDNLHAFLSALEYEFGCMVGCNAYLTPSNAAQGFAPHYDDIEAFIIQVHGSKHWKVFAPMNEEEILPRESSPDYTFEELEQETPVFDGMLNQGELLYIPRGFIHYAKTPKNSTEYSLHLTVSAMQRWSWGDFLEPLMNNSIDAAIHTPHSNALRQGLPRNFLNYMGAIHDTEKWDHLETENNNENKSTSTENETPVAAAAAAVAAPINDKHSKLRHDFKTLAKKHIQTICQEAIKMIDQTSDQMAMSFMYDRLPPAFTKEEKQHLQQAKPNQILPTTRIRLIRNGVARLIIEKDKAVIYHCVDNEREYHGNIENLSPLEFELDDAPALEMICNTFEPDWIRVNELMHDSGDMMDKIEIVRSLVKEEILMISNEEDDTLDVEEDEDGPGF